MTADIEAKLSNLVSGVYYGWAEFLPSETEKDYGVDINVQYPMVMSIGFNPYFNNKHKTAVRLQMVYVFLINRKHIL